MQVVNRLFMAYNETAGARDISHRLEQIKLASGAMEGACEMEPSPTRQWYARARLTHLVQAVVCVFFVLSHSLHAVADIAERAALLQGRAALWAAQAGARKIGYELGIIAIHIAGVLFPVWVEDRLEKVLRQHASEQEMGEQPADVGSPESFGARSEGSAPGAIFIDRRAGQPSRWAPSECPAFSPVRDYRYAARALAGRG